MGVLSKEVAEAEPASQSASRWSLRDSRTQGALVLAATIALQVGGGRIAAKLLHGAGAGSVVRMVGAAAEAVAAPSVWASEGVQKSASFFVMIIVGFLLRIKIKNKAFHTGIKELIMNALLPCVTFKGLVGITMSREVIKYPLISGALIIWYLVFVRPRRPSRQHAAALLRRR